MNQPRADFGFYATIPRMVRTGYKHLTAVQKWLYACLKDLCGDNGTCYRSLRALSEETGISTGMLSESIRLLHDAELIHAEKKKRPAGGKEVWHITIADIWIANGKLHPSKRSHSEQTIQPSSENVHSVKDDVQQVSDKSRKRSAGEQERSLCETEERTSRQEHFEGKPVEERTLVPSTTQSSSISSQEEKDDLLKWLAELGIELSKDTPTVKKQLAALKQHITTRPELHRLYALAEEWNRGKKDETVYLGNLVNQKLLNAFLKAEQAMLAFTPAVTPAPVETASQGDIEGLVAEIQSTYPELELRTGEDDYGAYIDVVYGKDKRDCWTVRSADEWEKPGEWEQKCLARAIEYGKQHCLVA